MTESMSREEAEWATYRRIKNQWMARNALDALRDLAKSRPIDLGDGVIVARMEEFGTTVDRDEDDEPIEGSEVVPYRIRTDQPAAEEPAP